jgi:hypothetical protein
MQHSGEPIHGAASTPVRARRAGRRKTNHSRRRRRHRTPRRLRPSPLVQPLRRIIEASVGQVFGILVEDFDSGTRGRARVALARQIAMYLTHVGCRQSLTSVGRIFERDRTTVAHACAVIEDMRDDRRFDRVLDLLESIISYRLTPREVAGHDSLGGTP